MNTKPKYKLNDNELYCNLCGKETYEGECYCNGYKMFCEACAKRIRFIGDGSK